VDWGGKSQEISRIEGGGVLGGLDIPVFEDELKEEEKVVEKVVEKEEEEVVRVVEEEEDEEEEVEEDGNVIEYDELYARQINNSVKQALKDAKTVFDLRNKNVTMLKNPENLKPGSKQQVVRMGVGGKGSLQWKVHEFLGEGAYGQVFFVENKGEIMAMKVQKDIGSLAWEYVVMRRIQDRLGDDGDRYVVKMPQLQLYSDGAYCLMDVSTMTMKMTMRIGDQNKIGSNLTPPPSLTHQNNRPQSWTPSSAV
jgi:hypothetical protein